MTALQLIAIVLIAAAGGAAAFATWLVINRHRLPNNPPQDPAVEEDTPVSNTATDPPQPPSLNPMTDPALGIQIARLSDDLAALAERQVEREERLLMEIRAAALVKDPAVTDALRRIEGALGLTTTLPDLEEEDSQELAEDEVMVATNSAPADNPARLISMLDHAREPPGPSGAETEGETDLDPPTDPVPDPPNNDPPLEDLLLDDPLLNDPPKRNIRRG